MARLEAAAIASSSVSADGGVRLRRATASSRHERATTVETVIASYRFLQRSRSATRAMKTSSSDGGMRRTLVRLRCPRAAARRRAARRRRAASPASSRTCSALAEHLHVDDSPGRRSSAPSRASRSAAITSKMSPGRLARRRAGVIEREQPAFVQQRDARAPLRFVQIRRRHHDRDALRRNSDSSFQNSRRDTGSTPVVGSSSRMTRGSCTSVQASASFCFMPPES